MVRNKNIGKWRSRAIAIAIILILGGAIGAGILRFSTIVGGSVWQFDYQWTKLDLTGTVPLTGATRSQEYTDPNNPYEWTMDMDGTSDGNTQGNLPTVVCTVGIVGRADKNGNNLPYDYKDPFMESYAADGKTYYKYYYLFDVKFATASREWTAPIIGPQTECGAMDIEATLTVILKKSVFDNEVDAFFADARIFDIDMQNLNLGSIVWRVAPEIDVIQDKGDGVAFTNIQDNVENAVKTGDLTFHSRLTPGVAGAGWFYLASLKYDVWIVKRVMVCLLLAEPLSVGDPSKIKPFKFTGEMSLETLLMIIVLIIVVVIVISVGFGLYSYVKRKTASQTYSAFPT
jgi:hypothetical protein